MRPGKQAKPDGSPRDGGSVDGRSHGGQSAGVVEGAPGIQARGHQLPGSGRGSLTRLRRNLHTLTMARHQNLEHRVLESVVGGPISPEQMRVLRLVVFNRGIRVGEVAAALGTKPSSTSLMLDRMTEHGFLERFPDGQDGRVLRLRPTENGLGLFLAAERDTEACLMQALSCFTAKEVRDLTCLLGKLTKGLLDGDGFFASLCFHCGANPDGECSLEMNYKSCPYRDS
ncbi:MAG: hypothetical protein CMK00_04295 [Planctomycetes bacterium]|nr:hypothetical protein [Planctomycetota bacterium]